MSSQSLVRIEFDGDIAREAQRFDMQRRIREADQGPDGAIWLLEDGTRAGNGWLLKLTPQGAGQGAASKRRCLANPTSDRSMFFPAFSSS